MTCRILQKVCKTDAEVKRYGFDYVRDPQTGELGFLANGWRPGQIYPADAVVLPTISRNGLQYVSSGGQSGTREPSWPQLAGDEVTDGSVTWTAETISNDSCTATIVDSTWSADDSSITIDDELLVNTGGVQATSALVGGGVVGLKYVVTNTVTLSDGAVEESALQVSIA
jgi:hypothetical protein